MRSFYTFPDFEVTKLLLDQTYFTNWLGDEACLAGGTSVGAQLPHVSQDASHPKGLTISVSII